MAGSDPALDTLGSPCDELPLTHETSRHKVSEEYMCWGGVLVRVYASILTHQFPFYNLAVKDGITNQSTMAASIGHRKTIRFFPYVK